ncbi:MAG: DNA polymerase I [Ruminococcaceae bacterium]|nr:DNA polymerase I [Oscillospiraceae bacterium]
MVIDGNSLMNRAFYGIRLLTTADGRFTNAVVGFLNMLDKLRREAQPDGVAVAFDVHAPTFRHKMYDEYKAGRHAMPEELRQQMPVIKEILPLMGCAVLEAEGFEADDILGTLARAATEQGGECVLATGDRDAFQLISERVTVLLAATRAGQPETVVMDEAALREKYGLSPAQMIDLKALMGDASDHIPGVAGVGEKTALSLMQQFGGVEALYAALDTADLRPALRQKLIDGRESAFLSRTLGTICTDAPVPTDLAAYCHRPVEREALAQKLAGLELFKIIERWGLTDAATAPPVTEGGVCAAAVEDTLSAVCNAARENGAADILLCDDGVHLSAGGKRAVCAADDPLFTALYTDAAIAKRTHDYKTLAAALLPLIPQGFTMDTMLAVYLLNPLAKDYTLARLAMEYSLPPLCEVEQMAALAEKLAPLLEEQGMAALLRDMELPLALVLAEMERDGVAVDAAGIAAFGASLQSEIAALQKLVWDMVGYEFNLNSPKQLAKALFEDLGLPAGKKTKSGYSTNADVLEKLREDYPVVDALLQYRSLAKLSSTYCEGLLKVVGEDGRIHSCFNQTETRTGRISSAEPNLQNIPVRQELGRELRRFFRAREGWQLVDADYSQIELRVLAHMADEPTMKAAFNSGEDVHRITAAQVFGVPEEMVTALMRSRAKAVNFGIIYGIGAHSLSEDIGVSYGEAKAYIEGYLKHYSAVAGFMDAMVAEAKATGYAVTVFGRRRPLPELRASQAMLRAFGERVARNAPIQGTAADIIKMAMIRVRDRLLREGFAARLILQVHDELIVEAPQEEVAAVTALLQEEMENAAALTVKLTVDVHSGDTWYDTKG